MAKAKGKDTKEVLYRTAKWELKASAEQAALLIRASDGLREIYNWGLAAWMAEYEKYRQEKKADPEAKPATKLPSLFDQINLLTTLGEEDRKAGLARGTLPRNWKEETLDALHGALGSFFALVKNGDRDARPPRPRSEKYFSAIPGRSGFALKKGRIVLAPNIFGADTLSFPIPARYQAAMLARATKLKKFVIARDERDLAKPGKLWVSVSYEIEKPEPRPFVSEEAVFVSLGASSVGVISPKGEEVLELWRSDKHWKPLADAAGSRCEGREAKAGPGIATRGSRKWRKRQAARAKMLRIMAAQQTQDRRELVARELIEKVIDNLVTGHGVHFVVTDLVVRSKKGKLADGRKESRGGPLGLNWSAQNTGAIGYLAQWLEEKAAEHGGTVRKHRLPREALPADLPTGHANKLLIARALKDDFLKAHAAA
jgi:putative transposase